MLALLIAILIWPGALLANGCQIGPGAFINCPGKSAAPPATGASNGILYVG